MRKTLVLGVIAAAALQAGCGHRAGGGGITIKADKRCDATGPCHLDVAVKSATVDECTAEPEFKDVIIAKGAKPTVRWKLDKAAHDPPRYRYEFALARSASPPIYGVAIARNDPAQDFDKPGHGKDSHGSDDKKTFEWTSVHARANKLPYVLIVLRFDRDAPTDGPMVCTMVDPRMVND